ncbi:MAG: hypothetical protein HY980_00160 [Candidatus Magasanikbacteria bacterium]|nr:hypothetical protein [Candidatus Magasanikbacteria bacterium]
MQQFIHFRQNDIQDFFAAFLIAAVMFAFGGVYYVYGAAVSLTVTVSQTLSFSVSTDQFATLVPGTYQLATTTLSVTTNDTAGWNVTLSGDNKTGSQNNCLNGGNSITDQTEWINAAATTSAGNAVVRASLANSSDVLAFRVMSASSTNGAAFLSTSWWGATDVDGTALWAGVASSTVQRKIGNAGTGSYSATAHINTVQYYVNVASSQAQGAYTCPLTFTATGN